jgi:diguanylate cyclase
MHRHNPSADEWTAAYAAVPMAVAQAVAVLVDTHRAPLAVAFYDTLLARDGVARLIPPQVLRTRLLPAIQRWMQFLFDPVNASGPSPTIALQRHVGEMHARAHIPAELVAQGFRAFKRELQALLAHAPLDRTQVLQAAAHVDWLTDLAQAEMRVAQTQCEAHRPTPKPPPPEPEWGLEAERRAQLLALSDEEDRFLRSMLNTVATFNAELPSLGASPLGQWLYHKAPLLFADGPEADALARMSHTVAHLDDAVLPRLKEAVAGALGGPVPSALLRDAVAGLEDVRQQVNQLFDRLAQADSHTEGPASLFSPPLLTRILRREMELARRKRTSFAVLMADVDHFTGMQHTHGTEAGDRALQHVAGLLTAQVRASDFVFRHGARSFVLVLVELDAAQSLAVAEKIRAAAACTLAAPSVSITLSLGVAVYQGHTDPQALTGQAQQALALAQAEGGNRVCMAPA